MNALRQSNASLGKASDIETAYSGSSGGEQLPSVDDVRMDHPPRRANRCWMYFLGAFVVIAAVIVTVVLVVTQAGTQDSEFNLAQGEAFDDGSKPTNLPPPTIDTASETVSAPETPATTAPQPQESTPTNVDRYGDLLQVLSERGISTMEDLSVQGSPQQRAAAWIADKDVQALPLDQTDTLVQRYVLAVFFYAMGGETWTNSLNFLNKEDSCKWYIAGFAGESKELKQFGVTCNNSNKVSEIHFREYNLVCVH